MDLLFSTISEHVLLAFCRSGDVWTCFCILCSSPFRFPLLELFSLVALSCYRYFHGLWFIQILSS